MIVVLARIEIAPGRRDEFLIEMRKILADVRAEEGCIEYGPTIDSGTDIEAQQPIGGDDVMMVEKWESVSALKAHLTAPHMLTYRQNVKEIVRGTRLQILEPAE